MAIVEVFVAVLLFLVLSCFGLRILSWTRLARGPDLASFLLGWAVGLGAVGLLTLLLGLAGLLYPPVAWIAVALILSLSHRELLAVVRAVLSAPRKLRARELWSIVLTVGAAGCALINLVGALSPPVFYDSLVAHLAHPNWAVINHAIRFRPYNVYTNYPLNIEMVYTFSGLLMRIEQLPKLLNWIMGITSALVVFSIGSRFFTRRAAAIAAALFYLIPSMSILSGLATHDLGLLLFEITSIYALFVWLGRRGWRWLVLSAVLCGFALGTKYTGLYFLVACLLMIALRLSFDRRGIASVLRSCGVYVLVAVLLSSPWFVKNAVFTGNPFYPVLSNVFGTAPYQKVAFGFSSGKAALNIVQFLRLPWDMTFRSTSFGSASQIGPLFLLSLFFFPFVRGVNRELRYMLGFSLVLFCFWAVTIMNTRYYLIGLALLSLWIGYLSDRYARRKGVAFVVWFVLGAGLLYNAVSGANLTTALFDPGAVVFGRQSRQEYLTERIDHYPVIDYANQNLPQESKVLFVGEARTYYTRVNYEANSAYDKTIIVEKIRQSKDLEDLLALLKKDGFTHVIYNGREAYRLNEKFDYFNWENPREKELFDAFTATRLETIYKFDESYLFAIRY
jgi:hypothetical protein